MLIFRDVSSTWQKSKTNCPLEASEPGINNLWQLKPEIMCRVCQIPNDLEKTGISVSIEAAKGAILEAKFTEFIITSPNLARDYRNRETFSPFQSSGFGSQYSLDLSIHQHLPTHTVQGNNSWYKLIKSDEEDANLNTLYCLIWIYGHKSSLEVSPVAANSLVLVVPKITPWWHQNWHQIDTSVPATHRRNTQVEAQPLGYHCTVSHVISLQNLHNT